jgi:hypothetical protein
VADAAAATARAAAATLERYTLLLLPPPPKASASRACTQRRRALQIYHQQGLWPAETDHTAHLAPSTSSLDNANVASSAGAQFYAVRVNGRLSGAPAASTRVGPKPPVSCAALEITVLESAADVQRTPALPQPPGAAPDAA